MVGGGFGMGEGKFVRETPGAVGKTRAFVCVFGVF